MVGYQVPGTKESNLKSTKNMGIYQSVIILSRRKRASRLNGEPGQPTWAWADCMHLRGKCGTYQIQVCARYWQVCISIHTNFPPTSLSNNAHRIEDYDPEESQLILRECVASKHAAEMMLVDTSLIEPFNFTVGKNLQVIGEVEFTQATDSKVSHFLFGI